MSRGLGRVQRRVLAALEDHPGSTDLEMLTHLVTGRIQELAEERPEESPPRDVYKIVARAVAGLERLGRVASEVQGYYLPSGENNRGHPSRLKKVRLVRDSSASRDRPDRL